MTYLSQQKRYLVIYIDLRNVLHDNKIEFMAVRRIKFLRKDNQLNV